MLNIAKYIMYFYALVNRGASHHAFDRAFILTPNTFSQPGIIVRVLIFLFNICFNPFTIGGGVEYGQKDGRCSKKINKSCRSESFLLKKSLKN